MNFKNIFIGKSGEGIEKLYVYLLNNFGYNITWAENYLDLRVIACDEPDYKLALVKGSFLSLQNSYNVKWIDKDGMVNTINDFCICRVYVYENKEHKKDINAFVSKMSTNLNIPNIFVKYNDEDAFYDIHINLFMKNDDDPLDDYIAYSYYSQKLEAITKYVDECLLFKNCIEEAIYDSFYVIKLFDLDGSQIFTQKEIDSIEISNLTTFSDRTIDFPDECSNFFGNDEASNKKSYYQDFSWSEIKDGASKSSISSDYSLKVYCNMFNMSCEDTFNIKSKVTVLSDTKLMVTSDTTVKRHILMHDEKFIVEEDCVYGKILKGLDYDKDGEISFVAEDYYEIISPNILIHYTNSHKFYETFKIPVGYKFVDGIEEKAHVVYDMKNQNYKPYSNITEVISSLSVD